MRTISFNVYKFNELQANVQEKVVERFHSQDLENGFLSEMLSEYLSEKLSELFPNSDFKFQYSLSYSQGDGLNVYGELSIEDALNIVCSSYTQKEKARLLHYIENTIYNITIPENNSLYSYCVASNINISDDIFWYLSSYRNLDTELVNRFEDDLKEYFSNLCSELEKHGYAQLYDRYEKAYVAELCEINNYEFYEDGEMVCKRAS